MAPRRQTTNDGSQLDLFGQKDRVYATVDSIRPDGRETLAGTPTENGTGTGSDGPPARNAAGGPGEDRGRNGPAPPPIDETGPDGAASARPGVGNGARKIHPPPRRERIEPARNAANY